MNYPPNKENYIDGIPDYGRWLGEIKAGFRVIGEELIIDKGEMYFTATPQNQPRNPQLVFRAGNDTYTLTYDITKMETITIRINDGNSELVSNVREYLREHNVSLKSLKQGFSTVGVKEFPGNDGTLGHLPSEISSVLYLNRLEMLNAIQLLDSGETQSFEYNGINYEFKHEGRGGIIAQDEGNIYTITIGEQRATILMPETDGNDIPLICFDNVTENDLPDRGGYNVKRIYATDGKIWIVASGTNFRNINDAYNSTAVQYSRYNKAKSDFWRLNRIFFGGN
jgi:hypothetical protein